MDRLPDKPREGSPCNGCGLCCALEICTAGRIVHPGAQAPCPSLKIAPDGSRTFCELVATEIAFNLPPVLQKALLVGHGCTMEDEGESA